ncbi:MAG: hypothetical protein HWN67_18670 [Candidatus Helarchaeota archaeon]|nr:hypothetical protein [Candidatus Helarchaeota archaeon]
MKTDWKKIINKDIDWLELDVTFNQVTIRSFFEGGRSWTENICNHKEFLDGKLQLSIKMDFGEDILNEVVSSVKEAPNYHPFQKEKEKMLIRKFFLEQIPKDNTLKNIQKHKNTINGNSNLSNIEDGKILLKSDNLILGLDLDGHYLENIKGVRFPFKLKGYFQAIVELHDFFYIVHSNNFAVISPEGEIFFDTYNYKLDPKLPLEPNNHLFDYKFSINNVYKHKNTIFFSYNWDRNYYKPGLIKYELELGLTCKWE